MKKCRFLFLSLVFCFIATFGTNFLCGEMGILSKTAVETQAKAKKKKKSKKKLVKKVSLTSPQATLTVGQSVSLVASVSPENASKKTLSFTSSNKKVLTVSNKGVVKAISAGKATITAKATDGSKKKASITLSVTKAQGDNSNPSNANYTIYPNSNRVDGKAPKDQSQMLKSYFNALETKKGGTLVIKAGTYFITDSIYVPSNITVVFEDGVVFQKQPSSVASIFRFIGYSLKDQQGVIGQYEGTHDVKFIGKGNVLFDLQGSKSSYNAMGIVMAHSKNISITGINFKDMSSKGHFIEVNSSQNVSISDCNFDGAHTWEATPCVKEAINIDSADPNTGGIDVGSTKWSKFDRTCCDTVNVTNCTFTLLPSGIGTHKMSKIDDQFIYHKNILVENCKFDQVGIDGSGFSTSTVRMMNWKDAIIQNNEIRNGHNEYGIRCQGVDNPTIRNNQFIDCNYASAVVYVRESSNNNKGSEYGQNISQNIVDDNLLQNTYQNVNSAKKAYIKDNQGTRSYYFDQVN